LLSAGAALTFSGVRQSLKEKASFKSVFDRDDVTAIRNYLIRRANEDSKGAAPSAAER
jgi:hypothetical protein